MNLFQFDMKIQEYIISEHIFFNKFLSYFKNNILIIYEFPILIK
jgi:hypothetical protein